MIDHPKGPWVKFFPSDWLAGTRGLSAAETGVYITLVCMMYERREPIAVDERRLARLCGLPVHGFRRAIEALKDEGKIIETDGGLWNEKVSSVIQDARNRSSVNRDNASSRWEKAKKKQRPDDATAIPSQQDVRSQKKERDKSLSRDLAQEVQEALEMWNVYASRNGWPEVKTFSDQRRRAVSARIKESGLDGWRQALEKGAASSFVAQGTFFTFDFVAGPKNFAKVLDGNYDDRPPTRTPGRGGPGATGMSVTEQVLARAAREGGG